MIHLNMLKMILNKIPGPGFYNPDKNPPLESSGKDKKKIKSKQRYIQVKKRQKDLTPGPGSYIEPLDKSKYMVAPVTNSMFKSDSLRDVYNGFQGMRGPGPAFYKIRQAKQKKSYNYNPQRNWL
mmetsp:Transcript_7257/g.8217  ORF Transcript_7257/g.8217 Transcript_7257/m.8217 type:complete len:124 (+) Transcript_7257:42-413(+)